MLLPNLSVTKWPKAAEELTWPFFSSPSLFSSIAFFNTAAPAALFGCQGDPLSSPPSIILLSPPMIKLDFRRGGKETTSNSDKKVKAVHFVLGVWPLIAIVHILLVLAGSNRSDETSDPAAGKDSVETGVGEAYL